MFDLSRLSPEQREAVLAGDGPLQILAGPGSGKTTVLTARIAYLIEGRSVSPRSILALTFATKAARDIRARLVAILGDAGSIVDVATFHSFGLRVIRQWSAELGLGFDAPVVYDASDGQSLLADLCQGTITPIEHRSLADLARHVERYRLGDDPVRATTPRPIQTLAEAYEAVLRRRNAVDYPAMLALPLRLFALHPDALSFLQRIYRYVLVDEFQDVCSAQYRLVSALAARHRNLLVVGDPAQTVFTWRGADVRFFHEFQQDFPAARVIGLDHNFRSTGRIVALANVLGNPLLYRRPLRTDNPPGDLGLLIVAADERAEAQFVADEIALLSAEARIDCLGDVAVLYRINHQASELTLALRERGLPYRLRGRADLLERRVVHDAIGHRRLGDDPPHDEDNVVDDSSDDRNRVVLSTIHAAKGCEWQVVFVVGMEEGLLPFDHIGSAAPADRSPVDDERRVAYVAVTRPRERLYLTWCRHRWRGLVCEPRRASRFLRGLPLEVIEHPA